MVVNREICCWGGAATMATSKGWGVRQWMRRGEEQTHSEFRYYVLHLTWEFRPLQKWYRKRTDNPAADGQSNQLYHHAWYDHHDSHPAAAAGWQAAAGRRRTDNSVRKAYTYSSVSVKASTGISYRKLTSYRPLGSLVQEYLKKWLLLLHVLCWHYQWLSLSMPLYR